MNELNWLSAVELTHALRTGALSSREVTEAFLTQIDQLNPQLNAVVTLVADRALDQADAADRQRAEGADLPPLHGLPVLHKDTHTTAGIRTTSGSPLLADNVPTSDDLVIARLKAAGVISLGKTNTPEFAAGSHTFNPVFGRTNNPYDLSRTAGGSSGGAAVALATGMCPLADGSDMGGSLRNPAAFCNVIGLRATSGRVPNAPDEFGFFTLSTSGPMARTVDDVALMLAAMAGPDPRAPMSLDTPGSAFATVPQWDPSRGRIAVAADFGGMFPVDPQIVRAIEAAGEVFASLGATVERAMPDLQLANDVFRTRRAWQFMNRYEPLIAAHPDQVKDTIQWNAAQGRQLTADDFTRAVVHTGRLYQNTRVFFEQYDALLLPTTQVLPFDGDEEYPTQINGQPMGDYIEWMRSCSDITATGAPAISIPAGFSDDGLPIGLQIVAAHRREDKLLAIAKVFEAATGYGSTRPAVAK